MNSSARNAAARLKCQDWGLAFSLRRPKAHLAILNDRYSFTF